MPDDIFSHPHLLSGRTAFGRPLDFVDRYALRWIRNPDHGSSFDRATRLFRLLPDRVLLALLKILRYDGFIFSDRGKVVAHTFFQRRGDAFHMFSVVAAKPYQGMGFGEAALLTLLEHGRRTAGIAKVRFGAGGHPGVIRIIEKIREREGELQVSVVEGGWIRYLGKSNPSN